MNPDPKSVQKLTDLEEPKSVTELVERLNKQHPKLPKDATPTQQQHRLDAIINGILASPLQTEENKTDLRNQTWESNHNKIVAYIGEYIEENHAMPSVNHLTKKTGLSRQTILKHLREFHLAPSYQEQLQQFRLMTSNVLAKLYALSMHGEVKAAKVYLDAVGGLPGLAQSGTQEPTTNYIQINNNIKIDQPTFAMLPESVQRQIADLVLQGLLSVVASPSLPAGSSQLVS